MAMFDFSCLSQKNKCLSFNGSDGRFYRNELCFDTDTTASKDLSKMTLLQTDKDILSLWDEVLKQAKQTSEYNSQYKYGLWQIEQELNVYEDKDGKVWTNASKKEENKIRKLNKKAELTIKYVHLNTAIKSLKTVLKDYYKTQIQDKLFKYELLK